MKFFEHYFKDTSFAGHEEVKVLCPFHDDHSPSASINTKKGVFHCWSCGLGLSEAQFIAKINGLDLVSANKVLAKFAEAPQNWDLIQQASLWANASLLRKVEALGFTRKVIQELKLGATTDDLGRYYLAYPVLYMGVLMDVRRYNILKIPSVPKIMSNRGADSGFLIPYDQFVNSTEKVYLFEGEKKMALARSIGLNAYTLTGGALSVPNEFTLPAFEGKDVVICYDYDDAGREGAKKVANTIHKLAKSVNLIDIAPLVKEDKDDIYDAVMTYGKTVDDFLALPEVPYTPEKVDVKTIYTKVKQALEENIIERTLITEVIVSAEFADSYAVPSVVTIEKISDDDGEMVKGEVKTWMLDETKQKEMLELMEVDAKRNAVNTKLIGLAGADKKGVKVTVDDYVTVYKVRIMDRGSETDQISLDLYTHTQLLVGRNYLIFYTVYPHPTKHQKLVAVASKVEELDSYDSFVPDKALLAQFQGSGTLNERVQRLYQSAKHHVAKHLNFKLWFMSDMVFNSILEFDYQDRIRGSLDVFILGDTQVGKSETTSKLVDLYKFGHFLSLKTSTTVGLIGGSNKVEGSWLNTIGAIPRQHKKLAVMEEFSGAKPDFISTMTDIRSSGKLRLARAAGEMNVPCRLRMITISNPINDAQGNPRALSTFPNGVQPLMELVKSAEDVARYDGFLLVSKVTERVNPFSIRLTGTPIPSEAYEHKAMWVATRSPEDVIFAEESDSYIWEKSEELNALFESNFPLFGVTTPLKLARFSVALASLIVNTDNTYTKVIVTKAIVDYVVEYLKSIYDNDVFKLREYKKEYDSYNELTNADMVELQKLYPANATLLEFINTVSSTSRNNIRVISGLDGDSFNGVFNRLVAHKFVRLTGENVMPTGKFRLAMTRVNKKVTTDTGMIKVEPSLDAIIMPRKD